MWINILKSLRKLGIRQWEAKEEGKGWVNIGILERKFQVMSEIAKWYFGF